ncbi:MAG: S-layer homology domain-containing protein, partial [Syntrophomonadaceae bacterium]|nr:S-layer homology domain-containing protein [Syntrophomonadaceae bacterium]
MKRFMQGALLAILVLLMGAMTAMAQDAGFKDIAGVEQENAIIVACDQQLMNGVDQAQFMPEGQLTRAQLAVVLQRTFELSGKDVALPEGMYADVAADSWYAEAARACAANGVFAYAAEFGADEAVPRSELAVCVQQAFAVRQINIPMTMQYPLFEDTEDLTSQELMAVIFVNNTGIMPSADGYFRPDEAVTRAELAQTLLQIVELTAVTEDNDEVCKLSPGRSLVISLPANAR